MITAISSLAILVVFYMIYRDAEERHSKSLRESSELLYKAQKELSEFKEYYYKWKDEYHALKKEVEKYKKKSGGTNPSDLAEW
jgi:hypothetical protein